MKALILAAGYATRLYPLTRHFPKPLLLVRKRPIIDYLVDKLDKLEQIDEIIVITNSKFVSKFRKWAKLIKTNKPISVVDDLTKTIQKRRGAIGDMNFAINRKHINEDLLVVGGDNLFDGDLNDFLSFANERKGSPVIGIFDIRNKAHANQYGVVEIDKKNRICDFKEKPKQPTSSLVAMCLYFFPKDKLALLREYFVNRANKHDATGFYIDWLRKKEPIYGYVFKGCWYDIGDVKFFQKANQKFCK